MAVDMTMNILVVDDYKTMLRILRNLLRQLNFTNIQDATESIEVVMESVEGEANQKLLEATTRIYEACGFRDITGQRITKVVKALMDIEEKVDALLNAFGSEFKNVKARKPKRKMKDQPLGDEDLLQGPQNPDKAKSQEEIDALLASFD